MVLRKYFYRVLSAYSVDLGGRVDLHQSNQMLTNRGHLDRLPQATRIAAPTSRSFPSLSSAYVTKQPCARGPRQIVLSAALGMSTS